MPFIGRDWRSPGEAWVKTETLGWQRMKIIESQLYPACHQNPACSWPPRSHFGQHMANNCHKQQHYECHEKRNSSLSGGSRTSDTSSSSPDSSNSGSASSSPTGSPEKSPHHLHPITISSPYGQYSCCAHYHHLEAPPASPKTNYYMRDSAIETDLRKSSHQHDVATSNDQSHSTTSLPCLSRESIGDCSSTSNCNQQRLIRNNNSVSDFRNSPHPQETTVAVNRSIINYPTETNHDTTASQLDMITTTSSLGSNSRTGSSEERSCSSTPTPPPRDGSKSVDKQENDSSSPSNLDEEEQTDINFNNRQNENKVACQQACCACCCTSNQCPQNLIRIKESKPKTAPHCRISVRTREVAMYNTISEAFYRLDFYNAIHDIRRFNYICKLLHLLITQNLTSLSGCATKVLFTMLEQVAWEVSSNKRNIHVLTNLLNELKLMIQKYYCWGRPIGSSLLWQQHFDTIERISQIVDGIELSPPKNDNDQPTFDKLPAEMIREILLRLNDYRDLVNSAQASPVMRTMINSQYIWRQLCRYHFTDQQLKLAFDSHNLSLTSNKKGNTRGVKYARTTSADGRSSYRNPVEHKSSPSNRKPVVDQTNQQQQQQRRDSIRSNSSQANNPVHPNSSSSYVTRAIRIFDQEGSSLTLGSSRHPSNHVESSTKQQKQQRAPLASQQQKPRGSSQKQDEVNRGQNISSNNVGQTSPEIDWERVFHQLRKKFDLKEEYADCLLLCRHCRCLFWKSFGHPCIKGEELAGEECFKFEHERPNNTNEAVSSEANCNCDIGQARANGSRSGSHQSSGGSGSGRQTTQNRPSVASLSRNFDLRAQRTNSQPDNDAENVPPNSSPSNVRPNQLSPSSTSSSSAPRLRASIDNLNAQLQERNASRQIRRQNQNNRQNNNFTASVRRDDLVPKHVTISPQAFLKFFSL